MKQIFTFSNIFFSIVDLFLSPECSVFSVVTTIIMVLSLSTILYMDSVANLPYMKRKLMWVVPYIVVCVYSGIQYVAWPEWLTFILLMCSLLALAFALLCAALDLKAMQINPPNAEYSCELLSYVTFSYLNETLIKVARLKKVLQFEDVPKFVDADSSEQIWDRFRLILSSYKNQISLPFSLLKLVQCEWATSGVFQFIASWSLYGAPLALERILLHISHRGRDDDEVRAVFPVSIQLAVVILFAGPIIKSVGDSQNYMRGR